MWVNIQLKYHPQASVTNFAKTMCVNENGLTTDSQEWERKLL